MVLPAAPTAPHFVTQLPASGQVPCMAQGPHQSSDSAAAWLLCAAGARDAIGAQHLAPHIYLVAATAFRRMLRERTSQSLIVNGAWVHVLPSCAFMTRVRAVWHAPQFQHFAWFSPHFGCLRQDIGH